MAIKVKYHNSPNGPRICKAEIKECIYANAGDAHYASYEEAQTAYETAQVEKYGQTSVLSKSDKLVQKAHKSYYINRDRGVKKLNKTNNRLKARVRLAKASPEVQQAKAEFNEVMKDVQTLVSASEEKAKQFKNRLMGNYLFAKMRAKSFINLNKEKYTKLSNKAIRFKNDMKIAKNVGVNRMKENFAEKTNRLKVASQRQQEVFNALRGQTQNRAESNPSYTKLSEDSHSISPEIVNSYFESLEKAQKGRRRAEKTKSFSVSEGRRRAIQDIDAEITVDA